MKAKTKDERSVTFGLARLVERGELVSLGSTKSISFANCSMIESVRFSFLPWLSYLLMCVSCLAQ